MLTIEPEAPLSDAPLRNSPTVRVFNASRMVKFWGGGRASRALANPGCSLSSAAFFNSSNLRMARFRKYGNGRTHRAVSSERVLATREVGLFCDAAAALNEALGISFANNLPGCSSHRVCVLHCFVGFAGVFTAAVVSGSVLDSFGGNTGVGAGKIEDVGFGNDDIVSVATGVAVGRIGGGIPGGRFIGDTALF